MDWKIEVENLNAILTTFTPVKALTKDQLKVQLQSILHPDLRLSLSLEPVLATNLAAWSFEVKEHDDRMRAENAHTQKLINASSATHALCQSKKKDILSQTSKPPAPAEQKMLKRNGSLP